MTSRDPAADDFCFEDEDEDDAFEEYNFDSSRWRRIAEACYDERPLHSNEREFVRRMVRQTGQGRVPSPAQGRWLAKIYQRCRRV